MKFRLTPLLRALAAVLLILLGATTNVRAQTVLFITDGDSQRLQAIDTTTGNILYTAVTSSLAYPIAVRSTINLGHRDVPGLTGTYDPVTGALIGSLQTAAGTPSWSQTVDGAVNGAFNYTFAAFTNTTTVYQTTADWSSPVALFTLTGSDLVGITFDSAAGNLWVSDSSNISQYTLAGTLVSQFSNPTGRSALAYQGSTDTLWLVPNNTSAPLLQFAKNGTLLQSLTVNGRSGNVFGAEFSAIPEPSTWALTALGAGLLLVTARRRRA